ncbi:MAG TPA: phosphoribosylaminoimidazolesuccinocarboxamide synthase [Saprospiraceae bacterium]|nr:phosphoribosylaminoimidazolesuccinocarboxamide synthase [Saprospiraceae bacterium]
MNSTGMLTSLTKTDFHFKEQESVYHGKVRDVYFLQDKLIIIASDRISAFDHILPRPIPYKGQVLNLIAAYFLEHVKDICPVWLESVPDPNVSVGKRCNPIPIEVVVRHCMAGHAWRVYKSGVRELCGVKMPDGMREGEAFPQPIITPTSKAAAGHDEDMSYSEILRNKIVTPALLDNIYQKAFAISQRGKDMALDKKLILVDTKYEFGLHNGELTLMDEIHTPDSSRYYLAEGYAERMDSGQAQTQLSKEFVREWLMDNGFAGQIGQQMPAMPDDFVSQVSARYIELYEKLTGKIFQKNGEQDILNRIEVNLKSFF